MRKNIFYLTTLAIIMLLGACSNEPLFDETGKGFLPGAERLISLTATMPNDGPTTRVALEQKEDLSVALTWEEGDQLQLVFVQGDIKVKKDVTVGEISSDGKNASFEIIIPAEITENFDLYGVYGGGGLSNEDPTVAILPAKAGETGTLESIEEQEHVMFYFASKDMKVAYSEPTVLFKNFGSLFSITLQNSGSASLDDLAEARLVGVGGDEKWAYNIGEGGGTYNLITGEFQNTEEADNYISFKAEKASLAEGESMTFWGWYPPLPGKVWPALELQLLKEDGSEIAVSTNTMEERTEETAPGMSYYFNAEWDGSALGFGMTKGPHIFVKVDGEATNDGSSWAQATTLTTALELMEEGDEIHIAAGTYVPSKMLTGGDKEGDTTFEINKNVTLIGGYPADASDGAVASKANETILSGDKKFYHTVTVSAPVEEGQKVTLKNLSIKYGLAGPADEGIVSVNGVNYNRSFGGGLSIGTSVVDVIDCIISDNESGQHVGGVYVHNDALAKFIDTDIIDNKALGSSVTNCGGILNAATTYLIGCNVLDNASGGVCGGIYNFDKENDGAIGPKLYIYNTTVAGNSAAAGWSGGGGLYAREGSHTEIVNSTFYNNEAQHGGGIRVYTASGLNPSSVDIISSTFYKNNGRGNGGALETQPGTTVRVYNTIMAGNTSPNGADILLSDGTTTSSYVVYGGKVLDKDGAEVAGKIFNHTTMISDLDANGTCMITASSPAATLGMDANLLQTLAATFTPVIDVDIITKDQLGVSRSDKAAMGAVVSDGSEPAEPTLPIADMLDVVFNEDGTAKDISPMNHVMKLMLDENAPITVTKNDASNLNIANFNPEENGTNPGEGKGSCFYFEYQDNIEFQNKLADGHTFECLVKFDVDYTIERDYETKFFSTHQAGGTGFLIANNSKGNGLTFLPNVPTTNEGGSNWIWTNSQTQPDGQSWYHLVGVWDKDAGKSYIYVNGEKKAEVDAAGFYRPAGLDPLWATIGADPGKDWAIQNPFKGSVAIARIYDKALTEAEAMLLWNDAPVITEEPTTPDVTGLVGEWLFDDADNLLKANVGEDLVLVGNHKAAPGPMPNNGAITIGNDGYYIVNHGIEPKDGQTFVNEYSIVYDVKVDDAAPWVALLQTDPDNDGDADVYVRDQVNTVGVAQTGYTKDYITTRMWHRIALVVNNGEEYSIYLDGVKSLTGIVQDVDDERFGLRPTALLFADGDAQRRYDSDIHVAKVSFYDKALTADDVDALGKIEQEPIVMPTAPTPVGEWLFNDPDNLLKATVGADLELVGNHKVAEGPTADNKAITIGADGYYKVTHTLQPGEGQDYVNEYSILYDIKVDELLPYIALFQTEPDNANDADVYITDAGRIGVAATNYSVTSFKVQAGKWHRLILSVKNGEEYSIYLDGAKVLEGKVQSVDGRFSFGSPFCLFADGDDQNRYDGDINVARVALYDKVMTLDDVFALGRF